MDAPPLSTLPLLAQGSWLQGMYATIFAVGAIGSGLAAIRTRHVSHRDTRIGLVGLLVLSGLWAGGTSVRLLMAEPTVSRWILQFELVVGLAAVGAWLYFVSAYVGETYHRQALPRRIALGGFLVLVAIKLTNPLHNLYVTTRFESTPIPHLVIDRVGIHLAALVLAYALAAVGFYALYRMLDESRVSTRPLVGLFGLAGVPVVLNLLGSLRVEGVPALAYDPLGVAAFAVGALFFTRDTFEKARWTRHHRLLDEIDEAVIIVDTDDRIRDFNAAAESLFPQLATATGTSLAAEIPAISTSLDGAAASLDEPEPNTLAIERDGEVRHIMVSEAILSHGAYSLGRLILCTDVTLVERQRQELSYQNEQLEGFSAAVAHELRNTITVVEGNLQIIADAIADEPDEALAEALNASIRTTNRMGNVIDDLTTIARYSQTVDTPEFIDFPETISRAGLPGMSSDVRFVPQGEGQLRAEQRRFEELLRQAARLTTATGGRTLTVALSAKGIVLTTDGEPVQEGDEADLFSYGTAVPNAEAGMLGPNIRTLARAHGWTVTVDETYREGIRIRITDVLVKMANR